MRSTFLFGIFCALIFLLTGCHSLTHNQYIHNHDKDYLKSQTAKPLVYPNGVQPSADSSDDFPLTQD